MPRDASDAELRSAYELKINAAGRGGSLALMQNIDAAYEVLRNPHRRRLYDTTGTVADVPRLKWQAVPAASGRDWFPTPAGRRRASSFRRPLALLAVIALGATAWTVLLRPRAELHGWNLSADGAVVTATDAPPPTVGPRQRLLPAVPIPANNGYRLLSGLNARFDPCLPVHWVLSGAEPWPGANAQLRAAIAEVSRDTGLRFQYDGTTSEPPRAQRASYQPERYGRRWAPVLIAWTDDESVPALAGHVIGLGGPTAATVAGHRILVSGSVAYDAMDLRRLLRQGVRGRDIVHTTLLHELGHLVGLDHVADPDSVMQPDANPTVADYSSGDRNGLAYAGQGGCPAVV